MPSLVRTLALTAAAALLTGLTGACSSDTSAAYNEADVTFASEMVAHHEQAVEMAEMTADRPLDPAVQTLVDDVRSSQSAEIETMTGWLDAWDKPAPDRAPESAMDMGGAMDGMMSHDEMDDLAGASDADFQRDWLTLMVEHHRGALEMAQAEVATGRYPEAVDLARSIESAQTAEIAQMEQLLAQSR